MTMMERRDGGEGGEVGWRGGGREGRGVKWEGEERGKVGRRGGGGEGRGVKVRRRGEG